MEDLAVSDDLGRILVTMLDGGKVVSSVCHGPAGLLPATRADGSWLFAGRNLTAFTDVEEEQAGLADKAPWLLESRLREAGATFSSGESWAPFVVVDDKLVTGQNPASSTEAAQKVVGTAHVLTTEVDAVGVPSGQATNPSWVLFLYRMGASTPIGSYDGPPDLRVHDPANTPPRVFAELPVTVGSPAGSHPS